MLNVDGRTELHNVDALVDALLLRWGRKCRGFATYLGFPEETPISRVAREGFTGAAQRTRPPVVLPADVVVVDKAVARLPPKLGKVVRVQYLSAEHLPITVRAYYCGCCRRSFYNRLARARRHLALTLEL